MIWPPRPADSRNGNSIRPRRLRLLRRSCPAVRFGSGPRGAPTPPPGRRSRLSMRPGARAARQSPNRPGPIPRPRSVRSPGGSCGSAQRLRPARQPAPGRTTRRPSRLYRGVGKPPGASLSSTRSPPEGVPQGVPPQTSSLGNTTLGSTTRPAPTLGSTTRPATVRSGRMHPNPTPQASGLPMRGGLRAPEAKTPMSRSSAAIARSGPAASQCPTPRTWRPVVPHDQLNRRGQAPARAAPCRMRPRFALASPSRFARTQIPSRTHPFGCPRRPARPQSGPRLHACRKSRRPPPASATSSCRAALPGGPSPRASHRPPRRPPQCGVNELSPTEPVSPPRSPRRPAGTRIARPCAGWSCHQACRRGPVPPTSRCSVSGRRSRSLSPRRSRSRRHNPRSSSSRAYHPSNTKVCPKADRCRRTDSRSQR